VFKSNRLVASLQCSGLDPKTPPNPRILGVPRSWVNMAHVSQSRPNSGLGCQVKVLYILFKPGLSLTYSLGLRVSSLEIRFGVGR